MNETAIVPYNAPPSQELNLQEEPDKAVIVALQENANETAIVLYNAPPSQEFHLQEELDKADAVQNNAPDDDGVAYLAHDKSLNEKGHLDSVNEKLSSDAQSGSGSGSEDEKSNKDYSGSTSENSGDSGS